MTKFRGTITKIGNITCRSKFEAATIKSLINTKQDFSYETEKFKYTIPASDHTYTPDFKIKANSGKYYYFETKGYLDDTARKKYELVKAQNPNLDLIFFFQNPNGKVGRLKKTCSEWADLHGFHWVGTQVALIMFLKNH